jgi:cyclophilin family peptidyl-prolyl cis-trans isomerase
MVTIILLGVTLFAVGCAGQSSPTPTPSSKPPSSTLPASSTKPAASSTTLSSTPTAPAPSSQSPSTQASVPAPKTMSWSQPPAMQIDVNKKYIATVETTLGSFKIQLFPQETPKTVNNFIFLSKQGYYNGVIFHRIMKTFMIQTGDPTGTGAGSPGYKFADELPPKHSYDPGIVAMANSGPNTNGSQFFICTGADAKNLNNYPNYTQFGQVTDGMDIVQKIAGVNVVANPQNPREISKPTDPPAIKSITITEQ